MLQIKQLKYQYQQVEFEFDLTVVPGEIIALMGPSGAGKSTLLSLIAGFIQPEAGDMLWQGQSLLAKAPYQRPFSMLFQEHNLFSHLSVRENISLGLNPSLRLTATQMQQVEQAAQQVGLEAMLARMPEALSGGQRQRVALARCFVQPNPIWLLDEPFSALDPVLRSEMLALVAELAKTRHITVIMVTHHLSDAKAIAQRFAFIHDNRVAQVGAISELHPQHPNLDLANFVAAGL